MTVLCQSCAVGRHAMGPRPTRRVRAPPSTRCTTLPVPVTFRGADTFAATQSPLRRKRLKSQIPMGFSGEGRADEAPGLCQRDEGGVE